MRFLRPYHIKAMSAVQKQIKADRDRFLFEMATGTGKTLTPAAVSKTFLKSSNDRRVLFSVERLEPNSKFYIIDICRFSCNLKCFGSKNPC